MSDRSKRPAAAAASRELAEHAAQNRAANRPGLERSARRKARFEELFMIPAEAECRACPSGTQMVMACTACEEPISNCQCLAGSFRRSLIDPDDYDPDSDPYIWNL